MKVLFAIAALTAAISASPVPIPDSSVSEVEEAPGKLFARADKLCRVEVKDQYVNCRRCPFTSCESVARFYPSSRFTVTCRHVGEYITNTDVWDLVRLPASPYSCWVSAHFTRSADGTRTCETNLYPCSAL